MDISYQNILIKKSNWNNGYWIYKFNNQKYYVKNTGYQISICDFGSSISEKFILNDFEKEIIPKCKKIDLYNFLMYLNPKYFDKHNLIIYPNSMADLYNTVP